MNHPISLHENIALIRDAVDTFEERFDPSALPMPLNILAAGVDVERAANFARNFIDCLEETSAKLAENSQKIHDLQEQLAGLADRFDDLGARCENSCKN